MAALHEHSPNGWHDGERAVHALLHVPTSSRENPTSRGLPPSYAYRVACSPLVAFGTLDDEGRPWTAVWGGEEGFTRQVARGVLGVQSLVDRENDPVVKALLGAAGDGEVVNPAGDGDRGKVMSALSIDLATRDRVKLAGRMVAGAVSRRGDPGSTVGEVQLAMFVEESLGNCPKYLNKKEIQPHVPAPQLVSGQLPLPQEAVDLIGRADLFFLSSTDGDTMDTNHRGGPPGFVRVVSNDPDRGTVLVYPEYSGNQLYQTLGNLQANPRLGLAIPDFASSSVLYLTGETTLLAGAQAAALLPHTRLAVRIAVHAARLVRDGLPFRGTSIDYSPYNPPVRRLASEQESASPDPEAAPRAVAALVGREPLTPTVSRFTFRLQPAGGSKALAAWKAGQHVTLDFSPELDMGWSHMRDDDPQSLNDDFVRTFTVSSTPPPGVGEGEGGVVRGGTELQITVRKHGPATGLLWKQNLRVPLELPVLGFGGEATFRMPTVADVTAAGEAEPLQQTQAVFVAGGVGITPLLAQAPGVLAGTSAPGERRRRLRVLWSLRAADLPLAVDVFKRIPGLAEVVTLFVTGTIGQTEEPFLDEASRGGAEVVRRRMEKDDVLTLSTGGDGGGVGGERRKYYVCTAPEMHKVVLAWLEGQDVVSESFNY